MKYYIACLILLFTCAAPLVAQETNLKGKVVPWESSRELPKLWRGVRITVKYHGTDQEIPGEQGETEDQSWFHVAPIGARVDVYFDKSNYIPSLLPNVKVSEEGSNLPIVKLKKCRDTELLELYAQRQQKSTRTVLRRIRRLGPTSPRGMKVQLEREARLARSGRFFDTFQHNFAVKAAVHRKAPTIKGLLSRFRRDAKNQDLFMSVGASTPEMFDDVVQAEFQISTEVNLNNIKKVIKEDRLSSSVRGSATVALLNLKPDNDTLAEMRAYYRQQAQNSSSKIFASSLVALARIGDDSDRRRLYYDILKSEEQKRTTTAMEVLATTVIIEGSEGQKGGAETLAAVALTSEDPDLRAAAYFALRPFAYQRDQIAIATLTKGARRDPDPFVRTRAVRVLGVGGLEYTQNVRTVLRSVARNDRSSVVRHSAKASLYGSHALMRSR